MYFTMLIPNDRIWCLIFAITPNFWAIAKNNPLDSYAIKYRLSMSPITLILYLAAYLIATLFSWLKN